MSSKINLFVLMSGIILIVFGVAKVLSAFGKASLLGVQDPLVGIPFRDLLIGAGILEVAIGLHCFMTRKPQLAVFIIACFATNLLVYRVCLWSIHWVSPCHCLGNLTDALNITPKTADIIVKAVLAYLLIGSYASLLWFWRQRKGVPGSVPA
jgi:hypothetical protein